MDILLQYLDLILFLGLAVLGYTAGTMAEKRHYASIVKREKKFLRLQVMTAEPRFHEGRVKESFLVNGSVVVSIDYFKRLLARLRNIFGGRVKSYESLVDRARREAILRMKEQARARGAETIVNLRLETSTIGRSANKNKSIGSVEAIAYGTAVTMNPK